MTIPQYRQLYEGIVSMFCFHVPLHKRQHCHMDVMKNYDNDPVLLCESDTLTLTYTMTNGLTSQKFFTANEIIDMATDLELTLTKLDNQEE